MAFASEPTMFTVEYGVKTPSGNRSRFTKSTGTNNLEYQARSETAVQNYLRKKHPGTEITIISLRFH